MATIDRSDTDDLVRWARLIVEAEDLRERSGLGLAGFWEEVQTGTYESARERLVVANEWARSAG